MIPVPSRMQKLERDRRGLPVPVVVLRDDEGTPHFAINEITVMARMNKLDRCSICGQKLTRGRWLIGGPLSAFAQHGSFADGPTHYECAVYALKVCPYLAARSYADRDKLKAMERAGIHFGFGITPTDSARPLAFAAVMSINVEVRREDLANWLYKPRLGSIRNIEIWRRGEILRGADLTEFQMHARAMLARHDQPQRTDLGWWW